MSPRRPHFGTALGRSASDSQQWAAREASTTTGAELVRETRERSAFVTYVPNVAVRIKDGLSYGLQRTLKALGI